MDDLQFDKLTELLLTIRSELENTNAHLLAIRLEAERPKL